MNWYTYNEFRPSLSNEAIEDVRIAATVEPSQWGLSVRLRTTARLDAMPGPKASRMFSKSSIDAQGNAALTKRDISTGSEGAGGFRGFRGRRLRG